MGRRKLQKFAEIVSFPNVYEIPNASEPCMVGLNGVEVDMKNHWHEAHFKNNNPITLELACGRGEYAVALGRMFPNRNFIGIDIKGARIYQGAKLALAEGLTNVAFLRMRIEQVDLFFGENEIDEIWITFPDPFLRESKSNRRLTSEPFLNRYRRFLKKGGIIHLKTDSPDLYDFTLETLKNTENTEGVTLLSKNDDIYAKGLESEELKIHTYYERANIAKSTIKYVKFRLS
jgi:tRNA (guanine-N7-)-methyltransferase